MLQGPSIATVLLLISTVSLAQAPELPNQFLISSQGAGKAKVGMTIDHILDAYGRGNANLIDAQSEGKFSPQLLIRVGRTPVEAHSLTVEIRRSAQKGWYAGRILVHDDRFKTAEGTGVGSRFEEIKKEHRITMIAPMEIGGLGAVARDIGMTFVLDWPGIRVDQAEAPDSARVVSVVVFSTHH